MTDKPPTFFCPHCHTRPGSHQRGLWLSTVKQQTDHIAADINICTECFAEQFYTRGMDDRFFAPSEADKNAALVDTVRRRDRPNKRAKRWTWRPAFSIKQLSGWLRWLLRGRKRHTKAQADYAKRRKQKTLIT